MVECALPSMHVTHVHSDTHPSYAYADRLTDGPSGTGARVVMTHAVDEEMEVSD